MSTSVDYVPDSFESNENTDNAKIITPGVYSCTMGQIDASTWDTEDWFKIYINDLTNISVKIDFEDDLGDLNLFLYEHGGIETLAVSATQNDTESINKVVGNTGYYFIRINTFDQPNSLSYTLNVSFTPFSGISSKDWMGVNVGDKHYYTLSSVYEEGSDISNGKFTLSHEVKSIQENGAVLKMDLSTSYLVEIATMNYACYNESQILVLNQNSDYEIYDYSNIVNGMYPFIPKTFVWDPNYITSPFMQLEGHTITISEQGKKFQIIYENTTTDFSFFFEVIIEYNQSGILQYGKIEQEIVEIATGHKVFQRNMIEYLIVETASDLPKEDKGLLDEITGYPLSMITFSILLGFPGLGFLINRKRQF